MQRFSSKRKVFIKSQSPKLAHQMSPLCILQDNFERKTTPQQSTPSIWNVNQGFNIYIYIIHLNVWNIAPDFIQCPTIWNTKPDFVDPLTIWKIIMTLDFEYPSTIWNVIIKTNFVHPSTI